MQPLKTTSDVRTGSTETGYNSVDGTSDVNATVESPLPATPTPPGAARKRTTWSDLSPAQRKYAKQLYIDEGWALSEALLLAKHDGGAA